MKKLKKGIISTHDIHSLKNDLFSSVKSTKNVNFEELYRVLVFGSDIELWKRLQMLLKSYKGEYIEDFELLFEGFTGERRQIKFLEEVRDFSAVSIGRKLHFSEYDVKKVLESQHYKRLAERIKYYEDIEIKRYFWGLWGRYTLGVSPDCLDEDFMDEFLHSVVKDKKYFLDYIFGREALKRGIIYIAEDGKYYKNF